MNGNAKRRGFVVCLLAAVVAVGAAQAAVKPGWSEDRAERHIEINVQLVDPVVIAATQEQLRLAKQIGGTNGIANAQAAVKAAKAGFDVDKATCAGARKAAGGFTLFRCKLLLTLPALELSARARGTLARNAVTGRWRWQTGVWTPGY